MSQSKKNNSGYKGALTAAVFGYAMAAIAGSAMAQHNVATEPVQVAQSATASEPVALDRITVKGDVLSPRNAAFSSTTFDKEQIRDQQVTRPESEIRWTPWSSLELSATLSYFESEVLQSANAALVGKRVPGTPRTQATVQGTYRFAGGWGARATQRHLGNYAVNDTNAIDYGGYNLLDLGVFYERIAGRIKQRYYATVSNVFDRAYATTALVLGGQRAFSPGAPIGVMVGASLNF